MKSFVKKLNDDLVYTPFESNKISSALNKIMVEMLQTKFDAKYLDYKLKYNNINMSVDIAINNIFTYLIICGFSVKYEDVYSINNFQDEETGIHVSFKGKIKESFLIKIN